MTTPYVDPQSVHNPATGTSPPAAWGDTLRDCVEMATKMPSACMTVTASQNLASGTTTAINCAGELWDTDAQHSTSTNTSRFTVATGFGGIYEAICKLQFGAFAGANTRVVGVRTNGAAVLWLADTTGVAPGPRINGTGLLQLNAGDYVEMVGYQDSGGIIAISTESMWWMRMVSR